jgi:hypothetical protein
VCGQDHRCRSSPAADPSGRFQDAKRTHRNSQT